MLEFDLGSEEATEEFAGRVARGEFVDVSAPLIFLLRGDLGAGKTTFVRGFVRALAGGDDVRVTSPTFALARSYETNPPVHHLDLYRLVDLAPAQAERSLVDLGLFDTLETGLSLIEWPLDVRWPVPVVDVDIAIVGDARKITLGERRSP